VILFGLPALVVAWMARERMREAWRKHRAACAFVIGATGMLLLAAFVIRVPTSAEYKWLLQSCGPLACVLGLGGAAIVERRRWTAWPLCAALCLGAGSKLAYRADWPLTEPLAFDGEYVRVGDSRLREALAWMRGNLPIDAVVISREAAVATCAGRSLAMGPDRVGRFAQHVIWNGVDDERPSLDRDEEHAKAMRHDGWMINATTMGVYMLGHSTRFVYARRNIVESVLASDWPIRLDITMASIAREFHARPVYVLTERADVVSKLIASGRFESRYAAQGWTILQVR
jgi:hypothetical protein